MSSDSRDEGIPFNTINSMRAKDERRRRNEMAREDEKKILTEAGINGAEAERILNGEPDFSLFNLVMTSYDHQKIIKKGSIRDAWHYLYKMLYPYIDTLTRDNKKLKAEVVRLARNLEVEIGCKHPMAWEDFLSPGIKEVLERDDPLAYSKKVLDKVREAANKRRRNVLNYKSDKPKIVTE